MFAKYLEHWDLTPDGEPIVTHSSQLLPVRYNGLPAMLKIALESEEKFGAELMKWWDGEGAARVYGHWEDGLLLERAMGPRSLADMARNGRDDEATLILCAVTARLHAPRPKPLPELIPLTEWFRELEPMAAVYGGLLAKAAIAARELFAAPRDIAVLHGDIHHGNILDGGERGWLAIDPKRLVGERGFDYVNILRNPDESTSLAPERFARQVSVIAEAAGLERVRFLKWTLAFVGLSAAWILGDGDEPKQDLGIAALAAAELARAGAGP